MAATARASSTLPAIEARQAARSTHLASAAWSSVRIPARSPYYGAGAIHAFSLYDRNPQKFVPNIFEAKPADYQKTTQRIWHTTGEASYISLPIVPIAIEQ